MLTIIFVRGDPENIIDRTIETFSKGDYCHVAIKFPWGIVESLGVPELGFMPGVRLSPINKYDDANILAIDIKMPDQVAAERKAQNLIGRLYSYIGCFEGGTYDITGIKLHPWIVKILNWFLTRFLGVPLSIDTGEWTMNCSETVTRILRAGGLEVLPGVDADCITPMDLVRYFNKNNEGDLQMSEETTISTNIPTDTVPSESISDVLADSASTIIDTAAASGNTSVTNWVTEEIAKLRAEINSTSNLTVAARDKIEIAALEAMSVVALTELKNLTAKLKDKVS